MPRTLYLVSFYFAPLGRADGINRTHLARMLADLGWKVEVICADNPRGVIRNYQHDPSLLALLGNGVERHATPYAAWSGIAEFSSLAGLAPDPFFTWRADAIRKGMELITGDGVIMAIVPPVSNAVVAAELARRTGLPLVLDFRDNVANIPDAVASTVSAFCASTPHSLREMDHRYGFGASGREGLAYFNGYPDGIASMPPTDDASDQPPGRYLYAGLLDWRQHPAIAAQAANLSDAPGRPISMAFYGPRNYYTKLLLPRALGHAATFHGYIAYGDAISRMRAMTAGVSTLYRAADAYCLPSKVFQYIATGRPVLAAAPDGALRDFVLDNGFGLVSGPRDAAGMARDMRRLADDAVLREELRASVVEGRDRFSMRRQASLLSDFLETR